MQIKIQGDSSSGVGNFIGRVISFAFNTAVVILIFYAAGYFWGKENEWRVLQGFRVAFQALITFLTILAQNFEQAIVITSSNNSTEALLIAQSGVQHNTKILMTNDPEERIKVSKRLISRSWDKCWRILSEGITKNKYLLTKKEILILKI